MSLQLLTTEMVVAIHDVVLNPGELQGMAGDKSIDGALARVENRLAYGLIEDVFDLAGAYAEAISQGHCFNDGNKRTAHQTMDVVLALHGIEIEWTAEDVGDRIIALAQGRVDAMDMAAWLRSKAKS